MTATPTKADELRRLFMTVGSSLVGAEADDIISVKADPLSVTVEWYGKWGTQSAVLSWNLLAEIGVNDDN